MQTITTDLHNWTQSPMEQSLFYRIDVDRQGLYRKEINPHLYGGHRILFVPLGSRIANEWIAFSGLQR